MGLNIFLVWLYIKNANYVNENNVSEKHYHLNQGYYLKKTMHSSNTKYVMYLWCKAKSCKWLHPKIQGDVG